MLRPTWERAIEELLFNKVIERYDNKIKTMALDGVAADVDSLWEVLQGWTKASNMLDAHDHPDAENKALPVFNDLRTDLSFFKSFVEKQKSRRTENIDKLKHLKK